MTISRRKFIGLVAATVPAHLLAAPPSHYEQLVLARRPVGYWRLGDAAGGLALDSSAEKHHGAYLDGPKQGQPGAIKGDANTAIAFAGSGALVEIPDAAAFSQPSSGKGLTVEAWMRPDALTFEGETADPYIHWLGKGDRGKFEWGFRFYSRASSRPNRMSAYIWNAEGGLGSGAYVEEPLEVGKWIHIVACFDPGDKDDPRAGVSIFKNGVFRGGPTNQPGSLYKAYNIKPARAAAPLRIGTRDRKSFFTGAIDEVAIYPHVLRPAEIMQSYRAGV